MTEQQFTADEIKLLRDMIKNMTKLHALQKESWAMAVATQRIQQRNTLTSKDPNVAGFGADVRSEYEKILNQFKND